jgi:hypothetical protein
MKRYKCIKPLLLDRYDDNGFFEEENAALVEVGEVYEMEDNTCDYLLIANKPALRLENSRHWIEIYPDTLAEHFEEMKGGE